VKATEPLATFDNASNPIIDPSPQQPSGGERLLCDHTANSSQSSASQILPRRNESRALHGLFKNVLNASPVNPSRTRNVSVFISADSPVAPLSSCLMDKLQELDQLSDSDDDEIIPPEDLLHTMNKRTQFRNCMGTFSIPSSQEMMELKDTANFPPATQHHNRHRRPSSFPLNIAHKPVQGPAPPPEMMFKFDCVYFTDGGSKSQHGSWALLARTKKSQQILSGFIDQDATNNVAEFMAVLHSLQHAKKHSFLNILIVTDSETVANFLLGKSSMDKAHLADIASQIVQLLASFQQLHVSHVPSHSKYAENELVDSLCTWILSSKQAFNIKLSNDASNLPKVLLARNKSHIQSLRNAPVSVTPTCTCCLKTNSHQHDSCPIVHFCDAFSKRPKLDNCCEFCLSDHHKSSSCFLNHKRRFPTRSDLIRRSDVDLSLLGPIQDISTINFTTLRFPQHQSREQFLDYWTTLWSHFLSATTEAQVDDACAAAKAWSTNYGISDYVIFKRKPPLSTADRDGQNRHPDFADYEIELAKRAYRAASLGPSARVADVSKALRKGSRIPLTDAVAAELGLLYPQPDDTFVFEPCPLPPGSLHISRHAIASVILARSPTSHPGNTGITFSILQHFCKWTYGCEDSNSPDIRWTVFCDLICKIMSGNASSMSKMLHEVFGAFFDKNAEKANAERALRNIGIEESLVRVASTLVFNQVIKPAIDGDFITAFDLGCSRQNGAEIFGRVAAMCASMGHIVTVFDVVKAFNNLRREDIKAAVANFNNPLLSAFVHFLFERPHSVAFTDGDRTEIFLQKQGILQGNPLSVFIFALTISWMLKEFRHKYPKSLTPTYVDDVQLAAPIDENYPTMLAEFTAVFNSHGLTFDVSNTAKTSVFSRLPLPPALQSSIHALNIRTQTEGIAPCKIPFGTDAFIQKHVSKQIDKFKLRAGAFEALWPALLKLKLTFKSRISVHECYLNLLRLSLLSMTSYTLRTVQPLFCAPYSNFASQKCLQLIEQVFPSFIELIGGPLDSCPAPPFPDMLRVSRDIMQLPMSLGGLSLRLPHKIQEIAYVASCGECLPFLRDATSKIKIPLLAVHIPDLNRSRKLVLQQLQGCEKRAKELPVIPFERRSELSNPEPLQHQLTKLLNDAEIVRISDALFDVPIYRHAFQARIDEKQSHCTWVFNPKSRQNFGLAPLPEEDYSRAIQIATLRPITVPRRCECGAVIDPVALHFLHCRYTNFYTMHNLVRNTIAATISSLLPRELAPLSVRLEKPVRSFYPLRFPDLAEGPALTADIVIMLPNDSQQAVLIADVSSVLARAPNPLGHFLTPLNVRSQAKRLKYHKYDIPRHLFFPISIGRTNVLSDDALEFCSFVAKSFPKLPKACDKLKASIGRAITVGSARTLSVALRQMQFAAFNDRAVSTIPRLCSSLFSLPQSDSLFSPSICLPVRPIALSAQTFSLDPTWPATGSSCVGFDSAEASSLGQPLPSGGVGRLGS
jgi:ribonuclease HI